MADSTNTQDELQREQVRAIFQKAPDEPPADESFNSGGNVVPREGTVPATPPRTDSEFLRELFSNPA